MSPPRDAALLRLPSRFTAVILCFAPLFRERSRRHAEVLLIGAVLVPGRRTVTGVLRIAGLARERRFVNHHRVLNRAAWSGRAAARVLLGLLPDAFAPRGPVIFGLDDTIERRRGGRIDAKGTHRDPVRSSKGHSVKASGLRWLGLVPLVPIPWAGRVWALPFLTALAPSERYCREHGRRHEKLTDWARRLVLQARRWMPGRPLVLAADSGFAALELLAALVRRGVTRITRLRLDAALHEPAPPRRPGAIGRPRTEGARSPNLSEVLAGGKTPWRRVTVPGWYGEGDRIVEICSGTAVWRHAGLPVVPIRWVPVRDPLQRFDAQALLCTDRALDPLRIVGWFVQRWQLEVTFREVHARKSATPAVERVRAAERATGLDGPEVYRRFAEGVVEAKCALLEFLVGAKREGRRVVGYGAPAKGNTLLNYCGIGPELLPFTVDRSTYKQGLLLPGTRIPVRAPEAILEEKPDYVLVLPWNLKDEVAAQMAVVRGWGGRFVLPIPRVQVF